MKQTLALAVGAAVIIGITSPLVTNPRVRGSSPLGRCGKRTVLIARSGRPAAPASRLRFVTWRPAFPESNGCGT